MITTTAPTGPGSRTRSFRLGAGLLAVLAGASIPLIAVHGERFVTYVAVLCLAAVLAASILWRGRGVLSARFLVLAYLFLSVGVRTVVLLNGYYIDRPHIFRVFPTVEELNGPLLSACWMTVVAAVMFLVGYELGYPRQHGHAEEPTLVTSTRVRPGAALLPVALGLAGVALRLAIGTTARADEAGGAFLPIALNLLGAGGASVVVYSYVQHRARHLRPAVLASLALGGLSLVLFGMKTPMLMLALAAAAAVVERSRAGRAGRSIRARTKRLVTVTLVLLAAAAVFGFVASSNSDKDPKLLAIHSIASRSYGVDAYVASQEWLDQGHSRRDGSTLLEPLYAWMPRQLWPSKPVAFSVEYGETVYSFAPSSGEKFFAPSYSGEWLLNFGRPGVLVGWALFGVLAARVDSLKLLPLRLLGTLCVVHLVEGPLGSQVWLSFPMLLGGFMAVRASST